MKKHDNQNPLRELFDSSKFIVDSDLKDRALAVSAEGITISDFSLPDNPLIYVNQGFEQMTGYTASEVLGLNCRFLQGPKTDEQASEEIRQAIRTQQPCIVEILNYRKDGTAFWNRLSITPIRDKSGKTTHFIGIQSDITRRKEAEEALIKAKQALEIANRNMKAALDSAARIQHSLLPKKPIHTSQICIDSVFYPCEELAGDILSFYYLDASHIGCYVLDVVGHGVPAALLSVTLSHFLSPYAGNTCLFANGSGPGEADLLSPAEVLENLNQRFPQNADSGRFFTILYGIYDLQTNVFEYASAGHPPMIYQNAKGCTKILSATGFPIGIVKEPDYNNHQITLHENGRLFLYSDGLVEIPDPNGILLTEIGLCAFLERIRDTSLNTTLEEVMKKVKAYSRQKAFQDDISLLAVERLG